MLKRSISFLLCLVCLILQLLLIVPVSVSANPQGGQVVGGDANISSSGNTMNIQQNSDRAIINWKSFDIGKHESVIFNQPSATSAVLNRIRSGAPSEILGNLKANGQVYLVNPDGFVFGDSARIDTSGFMATTSDILNDDFMKGNMDFNIPGTAGAHIINRGQINVADCGFAALVAPVVRNEGIIAGRYSRVALASGEKFQFDGYGDNLINFAVSEETLSELYDTEGNLLKETGVYNEGHIKADGGVVLLKAQQLSKIVKGVVSNTGVIEAKTVERRNGRIIFGGERDQDTEVIIKGKVDVSGETDNDQAGFVDIEARKVELSGNIDATGLMGGRVHVMGDYIWLEKAMIDASGYGDGGTVLIGGDYLGGRASDDTYKRLGISRELYEFDTATNVAMMDSVVIKSDSLVNGDGGKIVLWADNNMFAYGDISSSANQGDGGFIEVSGAKFLDIDGLDVFANSVSGEQGTVLFDPDRLFVVTLEEWRARAKVEQFQLRSSFFNTPDVISYYDSYISNERINDYLNNGVNVALVNSNEDYHMGASINVLAPIIKSAGKDVTLILQSNFIRLGSSDYYDDIVSIKSTMNRLNIDLRPVAISGPTGIYLNKVNVDTNGGDFIYGYGRFDHLSFLTSISVPDPNPGGVSVGSSSGVWLSPEGAINLTRGFATLKANVVKTNKAVPVLDFQAQQDESAEDESEGNLDVVKKDPVKDADDISVYEGGDEANGNIQPAPNYKEIADRYEDQLGEKYRNAKEVRQYEPEVMDYLADEMAFYLSKKDGYSRTKAHSAVRDLIEFDPIVSDDDIRRKFGDATLDLFEGIDSAFGGELEVGVLLKQLYVSAHNKSKFQEMVKVQQDLVDLYANDSIDKDSATGKGIQSMINFLNSDSNLSMEKIEMERLNHELQADLWKGLSDIIFGTLKSLPINKAAKEITHDASIMAGTRLAKGNFDIEDKMSLDTPLGKIVRSTLAINEKISAGTLLDNEGHDLILNIGKISEAAQSVAEDSGAGEYAKLGLLGDVAVATSSIKEFSKEVSKLMTDLRQVEKIREVEELIVKEYPNLKGIVSGIADEYKQRTWVLITGKMMGGVVGVIEKGIKVGKVNAVTEEGLTMVEGIKDVGKGLVDIGGSVIGYANSKDYFKKKGQIFDLVEENNKANYLNSHMVNDALVLKSWELNGYRPSVN